jgi:hypothetical protein
MHATALRIIQSSSLVHVRRKGKAPHTLCRAICIPISASLFGGNFNLSRVGQYFQKPRNGKRGQFFPIDIQQILEGKAEMLDIRIACFPEVIAQSPAGQGVACLASLNGIISFHEKVFT